MLLQFAESGHPIFRATTPLSRGQLKRKGRGKVSIHFTADQDTIDTIYRIIISVNQLSIYGAVAAICDEFEDHQDRTGQPVILVGQSIVLGEVKAEVPVHDEDPRNDQIIWQQYIQQVESLSPENKLSKFCKEAGFMRVVEVEQYFVTRDTGDFRQFQTVACREYTLPRDDQASQPKGWIQGNMRIGLVLEVTTSFQHFKYGIEIRSKSVNQDDSHSWVRISYGTVKYVNDSIEDDTENLADSQEEESVQTSSSVVAAMSKAKAKPQPRESTGTTTIPLRERKWIDIEPSKQDLESYDLSKKVINLLRHNQKLHREEDGAIQFYKIKFHLRDHHSQIQNWSDERNEDHKDPEYIDFSAPRLARYLQNAWKRHQDAVFWVDIDLGIKEGLVFYQARSNAIILQGTLPAHCIVKVERFKNGEKLYERQYLSPRPPPKISLKHDLNWNKGNEQGSTVEHQPVGKLVQQSLGEAFQPGSSKPTQFPKPVEDRTGQPVTQEIVGKSQGELSSSDRAGQPAKEEEKRVLKSHDRTGQPVEGRLHKVQEDGYLKNRDDADKFNLAMDDENIDFNISGVPNATVKRSQSISIHDLIQQIENHPQKEAIQNDLEQHRAFNPFSEKSKDAIMAAGNTELCEIINVEPKLQCKACLKHWSAGIMYCTCGHLMTDDSAENKQYISAVLDLFSIPNFYIRKGRPHGHRYGKAPGCKEYHTANQLAKRCRKKKYDSIHDRFIRDKTFRKAMIELGRSEKIIIAMDQLASENHTHDATRAEIDVYRGNWWIRSNVVNIDTMPTRHQPDFNVDNVPPQESGGREAICKMVKKFLLMVALENKLVGVRL